MLTWVNGASHNLAFSALAAAVAAGCFTTGGIPSGQGGTAICASNCTQVNGRALCSPPNGACPMGMTCMQSPHLGANHGSCM
jgi:hypothetical protein